MTNSSNKTARTVDQLGTITYNKNGKYHREDGPAVIYPNGR